MTYNIRGALGMDGRRCVRRIAAVIDRVQPDLLCLQEAHCRLPCSGFADQPRDDAAHDREAMRLQRVQGPVPHRPPGLDVKHFGKPLRVVAHDDELRAADLVKDILPL